VLGRTCCAGTSCTPDAGAQQGHRRGSVGAQKELSRAQGHRDTARAQDHSRNVCQYRIRIKWITEDAQAQGRVSKRYLRHGGVLALEQPVQEVSLGVPGHEDMLIHVAQEGPGEMARGYLAGPRSRTGMEPLAT